MKGKIVSLVLALCVLCSALLLAGCGQESTFQIIDKAIEKTNALDTADMKMEMTIGMAMEGMTVSVPITTDIKGKDLQGDNPVIYMDTTTSMLDQEMTISMYQEGEYTYMSMDDTNYKVKTEALDGQYDYAKNVSNMVKPLPEDLFKESKVTSKDGSTTAEITISEDEFNKYYSEFLEGFNETAQTGIEGEAKISDAVVTITVKDGYVVSYGMKFKMETDIEGQKVSMDVDVVVTYNTPGETITVTPPAGYKDYEELDMSGMLEDF